MVKTLILYESGSGFTEGIARKLSVILGPAFCCRTSQFKGNWEEYDYIVICAPVYSDAVDGSVSEYVSFNLDHIRKKKVILLCTCQDEKRVDQSLESLRNQLGDSVIFSSAIGGEPIKLIELALEIKKIKDQSNKSTPENAELNKCIDDFINNHNTCALATGHGENVRATPIEYTYMNGFIYILSEGGEKFANIIVNANVSLCIFNEFRGMNELGGIQITGTAELINIGNEEYISVLKRKGSDFNKIISLPISLNMIKITIRKVEFLWSGFSEMGYDVKQVVIR